MTVLLFPQARVNVKYPITNSMTTMQDKILFGTSLYLVIMCFFGVFTGAYVIPKTCVQFFCLGLFTLYTSISKNKSFVLYNLIGAIYTFLCSIGSVAFFGYEVVVSKYSEVSCRELYPAGFCGGYLVFVQILCTFAIYASAAIAFILVLRYNGSEDLYLSESLLNPTFQSNSYVPPSHENHNSGNYVGTEYQNQAPSYGNEYASYQESQQ